MMTTRGSGLTATGLTITMIAVAMGESSGFSLVLLLSFAGVLAGSTLIFVGVRVVDVPTLAPIGRPGVPSAGVRALLHYLRCNLAVVGLLLASVATTATADTETGPVLCFCMFVLLLLGLSLINVGIVLLIGEQEQ